jgi:site-specific DNA-methyltransferase (adenine-specific)
MKKVNIDNHILYCADCKDVLPLLNDIDACITDPPYGLSFMGKAWDYDVPSLDVWKKVHDVLKPGAHLVSFFGSRTYHRGAIPIEDAGFEIRDQLMWIYGSGFPKSHNIGKAIDKLQGNEREVVGKGKPMSSLGVLHDDCWESDSNYNETKGNSIYEGWGTALKPAHEPIVMARKPFKGTVANNVIEHGTGGINIDECRVETKEKITNHSRGEESAISKGKYGDSKAQETHQTDGQKLGRFPANVMHDGSEEVQEIFAHASRYFYCAKASKKDRDEGLEQLETPTENLQGLDTRGRTLVRGDGTKTLVERWKPSAERKNNHPTVKPTELMRYLCRLVTPKGGVVLDPFMGSGSTGKAAIEEGLNFVGIEMDQDYFEIAKSRIQMTVNNKKNQLF